jgi:thiol-disulfide isomerase/thioredoxin
MARSGLAILSLVVCLLGAVASAGQTNAASDIVAEVRAAMATGGLTAGDEALAAYRSAHGPTPAALEALCWLARGALADKLFDRASHYADQARSAAATSLGTDAGAGDPRLLKVVGAATEIAAFVLTEQGDRSEAVYGLRAALAAYRDTPIRAELEASLEQLSLENRPAPAIDGGVPIGSRLPRPTDMPRRPMLLFFWAHWCHDCKAESPMMARIADKYRGRGLTIVAPTRRYGYIEDGRSAAPERELRHIVQVRDSYYPFLKKAAVPVTEANYRAFGVGAVPMHVLIDGDGVVRLYEPGRMTEGELNAAIARVLDR